MSQDHTNRLVHETSPYLRQHARNTNQTVYDVAEAVTLSYSLFRSPPTGED